ncbi:MAG: VanZ family protein [Nocardioides sp.]|uniref:VanZ family protein n=1 Tax=Nocardioides sp. TaxID=35761 RepID=UPI003F0E39D1
MISTILVEHPWLVRLGFAAVVLVGPLVGAWLVPRTRLAWGMAAASLVPVVLVTMVPVDRELWYRCEVAWSWPTLGRVEGAANVLLFAVPVLLAAVASRRVVAAVLAGSALSLAIESVQGLVPALGRSCSTDDWLANSLGAVLGGLLAMVSLRAAAWRESRRPVAVGGAN